MPDSAHTQRSPSGVCPRCHTPLSGRGTCPACVFTDCLRKKDEAPDVTPLFEQIGGYQVLERLARGGMGVVFKARQQALNRVVAIKMLVGGRFADVEAVERFRAEAAAIARLRHPGIVAIHEVGRHEGHHWFSMDFIDGPSLAELLRDGPLDPRTAVEYLRAVAEAVEHAHQQGILHRDLKPSNILIDSEGRPHVTDFGLTREAGGDSEFTATGQIIGTPGYLPPEQAAGQRDALSPACDVYGLGATLYHLLTGRPPFVGETLAATLKQVLQDEPARPAKLNPRVNPELETICLKCLEKEPARRYGTARELAADLGRWLRHEPILARPGHALERLAKWARRHPALAVAYGVCASLGVALIALWIIDDARVRRSQQEAKLRLAEALVEQARAIRLTGQAGQNRRALHLLEEARSQKLSPELAARIDRTFIAALAQPDVQTVVPATLPSVSDFMHVAFDPSFERAVVPGPHNRFLLATVGDTNGTVVIPRQLNEADQVLGFSDDGRFVAFRRKEHTEVWDTVTKEFCLTTNGSLGAGAFLSGPARFARGEDGGRIAVYELPTGRKSAEFALTRFGTVSALASAAGGTNVIVGSQTGVIESWRVGDTVPRWRRELEGGVVALAAASALGQVAGLFHGDHLVMLELESGQTRRSRVLPVDESASLAFSPDNTVLAVGHQQDGVWLLDGGTTAILLRNPARTWGVTFSRDGHRIGPVWERGRAGWLDYQPSKILRRLQPDNSPMASTISTFSPDGRWIASASSRAMHVWETGTGRLVATLPAGTPMSADWSRHHGTLAVVTKSRVILWPTGRDAAEPLRADAAVSLLEGKTVHCVRFSPCGRWLAVAESVRGLVHVFNTTNWQPVATLGRITHVEWCDFSADGEVLVAGSEDPPARAWWNWRTSPNPIPHPDEAFDLASSIRLYSADGRHHLDCGERLRLWTTTEGSADIPLPLSANNVQFAAAFSPDGRLLAATQNDSEIHLIDLDTYRTVHVLEGLGNSRVRALTFDPTGRQLAALRERGEVQLWNLHEMQTALRAAADAHRR